ncbi:MAG TPA: class I adenylate-forming enzyme family protein [Acidimicrobiales bacterium]|nr:class I adenylate-forming enzyme family protein [Acidimicrobiales bacterium]
MAHPGGTNVATIIDAVATTAPERVALILADGSVCTYRQLREQVARWASALSTHGIGPGQRVALADWGGVRSTAVTLAAARIGAASAQMNPLLTETELAQLVDVSGAAPVGVAEGGVAVRLTGALGSDGRVLARPDDPPDRDGGAAPIAGPVGGGADDALVLFTSGTTGVPKPIAISHASLMARLSGYRAPFDIERPQSVAIMCVPSFHVGGMIGLLLNLYSGDTMVVQPRFDAGQWLELVSQHRASSVFLVPTMLARILDHPALESTDLSALRNVSYGAAAAPVELIRRAMHQWPHVSFANVFGQTETLGAYTTLTPEDHRDPARVGSVGRVLPGVEVRVVDPDTREDVTPGEVGELWVRSPQNVAEGWLETGDLAWQDADGYLYPTGRRSELINRGGEKFAPHEVAEVLRSHPAVRDAAVAGIPDAEMGERVGAAIVVAAGEPPTREELREWCRSRLAPFKLPEVVVYVDALPVNELGKLPRRAVVELIAARAALPGTGQVPSPEPEEGSPS